MTSRIGSSDQSLPITRGEGSARGRYLVQLDSAEAGTKGSRAGKRIVIIEHTSVPDALRGRCPGEVLVHRGVQTLARKAARSSRCVRSPRL